jgi:hypothetical protein
VCEAKLSVQNLLYRHVHEISKEVIIIKSNFNAVRSILKSMMQKIFFIRVRTIMNYTSLDSEIFRLSEYVFGFFSRFKKGWKHARAIKTSGISTCRSLQNQHFQFVGYCKSPIFSYENNQLIELYQF